MTASDVVESSEITRDSLRDQYLQLDTRGRVTIPASIRSLHGVDPENDDHEIWVELSIKSIDVVDASNDEERGDS
jgi:bifunctional DNA-binding transcriptional regulator/antitoxin component of YhaV-PrlF toxin-antitoxin module